MKFFKKHKTIILGLLMVVAVVAAVFILKDTINFDEGTAYYGNRLDGIDEVKVTNDQKKAIEEAIKDSIESVKVRVSGKLVNIIIETLPEKSLADAKALSNPVLAVFTEEQKKFYDFQFLISNSENLSQFPIIGYMQRSRDSVNWTHDREKVEG